MKRLVPLFGVGILFILQTIVWSQCPEDPNDRGICDTMYVEPWPDDTLLSAGPPYFVRVPIYATCDIAIDSLDSIGGFTIPLCYTHTDTATYCSLGTQYNNLSLPPWPGWDENSIFRHMLPDSNWMANRASEGDAWSDIILNLDGISHFWLTMIPVQQQRFGQGSKILLATMTFKVGDSTTICIDTCFWPPHNRLAWAVEGSTGNTLTKIPRPGSGEYPDSFKICFNLHKPNDVKEINGSDENRPSAFSLSQNYPNPFNPSTSFRFSLAKSAYVKIEIFNIAGQKVKTLIDEEMNPGVYMVDWDGKDEKGRLVSSGIYFYRMRAGDFSETKKMVLLK